MRISGECASGRLELKSAEMKQHAGSQRGEIRQAPGAVPDALDHGIEPLALEAEVFEMQ